MQTCETCAHWRRGDDEPEFSGPDPVLTTDRYEDEYTAWLSGWHKCGYIVQFTEGDAARLAFVRDASGYFSGLFTHPKFGCIHWKAIEP